jgi:hypothetical protein
MLEDMMSTGASVVVERGEEVEENSLIERLEPWL